MTTQITSNQCRKARSLLKWNIHDVVSKCNVSPPRLERFERASIRLTRPENEELVKLFIKHGIQFTEDFDVLLPNREGFAESPLSAAYSGTAGTGGNSLIETVETYDPEYDMIMSAKASATTAVTGLSTPETAKKSGNPNENRKPKA